DVCSSDLSVNSTSSRADTARCRFPVHWSRPDSEPIVQLLPLSTEPNRSPLPTLSSPPATTSGSADLCSHSALAFILFTRSAPLLKSPTSPVGTVPVLREYQAIPRPRDAWPRSFGPSG